VTAKLTPSGALPDDGKAVTVAVAGVTFTGTVAVTEQVAVAPLAPVTVPVYVVGVVIVTPAEPEARLKGVPMLVIENAVAFAELHEMVVLPPRALV
jgi:hypothetical protein